MPFRTLNEEQLRIIRDGVPERNFGGLRGFFAWLERRKYKMHLRVYLSRWRSYRPCPACGGSRLRPEALATRLGGLNIAELAALKIRDALGFFSKLPLSDWQRRVGRMMLEQVQSRMGYLDAVGLGYLTLDRTLRTLSGGESQRVALTSALGSSLVNMLYVLDEPSIGLHPADVDRLLSAVTALRDRGNSVLVVEHEETMLRAADQIIEIGPGAGERGGKVVFQGTVAEMENCPQSMTGDFLTGRRGVSGDQPPPPAEPRLDSAGRRTGQQFAKSDGRIPAGHALPRDRRERLRQKHAGRRHALSGPAAPDAARSARSRRRTTTCSATARSTIWCWSIKARSAVRRARSR